MTRREFLKACGLLTLGAAIVRPWRALRQVQTAPENEKLPPDSAYERMMRLRIDYMLADNPQHRFALNDELIALAFEMKRAGASRAHIMTMGQASLYHAKRELVARQTKG